MAQPIVTAEPACGLAPDSANAPPRDAAVLFFNASTPVSDGIDPAPLTYLAIRPTFEMGDYTVSSPVELAEMCQIQFGEPARPSYAAAFYDSVASAVDDALVIARLYRHLQLWYNGQELQAEFADWRSFARLLTEFDEDWEVVEECAAGRMTADHPTVLKAMTHNPVLAAAIAAVKP